MRISYSSQLPTYSMFIQPSQLQELRRDIWCDDPIPALLRAGTMRYDVDLAYRGSHIREYPKKSYHLVFIQPKYFNGARELHLNGEYRDASLIRNKLSLDFFHSIGNLAPEAQHVELRINGAHMGIYLALESVDSQFLKKRGLPDGAIYYAINDNANFSLLSPIEQDAKKQLESGYERKHGTDEDDADLRKLIYKINTIPRSDFGLEIAEYINVDKYLRWLAGVVCTQNFDGFIQNYALYRNSSTGQYEIIPWDYDATWGRDCNGVDMPYDYIPITGYNTLTARLLDVPRYRLHYKSLMTEILETKFTLNQLEPIIQDLYDCLRPHLTFDPYAKDAILEFEEELDVILGYIDDRNHYLREHLSDLNV